MACNFVPSGTVSAINGRVVGPLADLPIRLREHNLERADGRAAADIVDALWNGGNPIVNGIPLSWRTFMLLFAPVRALTSGAPGNE